MNLCPIGCSIKEAVSILMRDLKETPMVSLSSGEGKVYSPFFPYLDVGRI